MRNFPQLNGFKGGPELVRLIGHRGARGLMPENTLEGFEGKKIMHLINMNKCPYCEKMMPAWNEFKNLTEINNDAIKKASANIPVPRKIAINISLK